MRLPTSEHVVNEPQARRNRHLMVSPWPGVALASMEPPADVTTCFTMARPRPDPTRSTRTVTPIEALEETRQIVRIDPHAVISGSDDHVAAILANRQREGRSGTGVAKRVLGQVLDDHPQHSRPQRDRHSRLRVKRERDAGPISALAKLLRDLVEHRLRIV